MIKFKRLIITQGYIPTQPRKIQKGVYNRIKFQQYDQLTWKDKILRLAYQLGFSCVDQMTKQGKWQGYLNGQIDSDNLYDKFIEQNIEKDWINDSIADIYTSLKQQEYEDAQRIYDKFDKGRVQWQRQQQRSKKTVKPIDSNNDKLILDKLNKLTEKYNGTYIVHNFRNQRQKQESKKWQFGIMGDHEFGDILHQNGLDYVARNPIGKQFLYTFPYVNLKRQDYK